jgi:uncharacterized protein (DUF885 family)
MAADFSVSRRPRPGTCLPVVLFFAMTAPLCAQSFKPKDLGPPPPRPGAFQPAPQSAVPQSLADRTQALNQIFADYWQDELRHSPEMASTIGDHRYDDRLTDYSPGAYDAVLARGEQFIERLGAIDTTGMPEQEKLSKQLLVNDLVDQQESSNCEPWQTPVTQFSGIQVDLPALVEMLRFTSADDYDHYIARLNKVPTAFLQIETDMMLGEQVGRTEPQSIMQKVSAQVNALVVAKPEDTPFALPLRRLPANIPPQQQAQIRADVLTAIRTQVQPAYAHFAKYLSAEYIPQIQKETGMQSGVVDGAADACSVSGNARNFDAGQMQILELRGAAEKALGENFNLSAFRDAVKDSSFLPPDVFEKRIQQWIAQQRKPAAKQ